MALLGLTSLHFWGLHIVCQTWELQSLSPKFPAVQWDFFRLRIYWWTCEVQMLTPELPAVPEDCFCPLCLSGMFEVFVLFAGPVSMLNWTPEFSAVQGDCCCRLWVFSLAIKLIWTLFPLCSGLLWGLTKTPSITHPFVKQNDRLPLCELWYVVCHLASLQFAYCVIWQRYNF